MTTSENKHAVAFKWHTLLRVVLACALFVGLMHLPQQSTAAPASNTWHVAVTGDDANDCSSSADACRTIKTAMSKALPGDTIRIGAGTYFENLDILFNLTLLGAGSTDTIVDGGDLGNTVTIELIENGSATTLNDLTLQNGQDTFGGGLYVGAGQVNLTNVRILDNRSSQGGAGIFNQGRMNLTNVLISNNQNSGSDQGGGLLNLGQVNLVNTVVSDNLAAFGSGIGNRGVMTITASVIDHNLNASQGGGIANSLDGRLTLIDTTISNNPAGGGLRNSDDAVVVMAGGVITNNRSETGGGGVYNLGQLTFDSVGLYHNEAATSFGGGMFNEGSATLSAVTIQGNFASSGNGGGIYAGGADGSLTLNNSLIRDNQTANGNGGGVYVSAGSLSIINTQIMSNTTDSLGGGLYNATAATLSGVEIVGNVATTGGGGIFNTGANGNLSYLRGALRGNRAVGNGGGLNNTARAELRNLFIMDNQASNGGGLFNDGVATVTADTIANNVAANGGGLYNGTSGQLTMTDNSVHDNFARQFSGGGIDNRGQLLLATSSVYSNTSGTQGGSGLYNAAQVKMFNSTLSYNRALSVTNGGAVLNNGGLLLITNTTISTNYGPNIVQASGLVTIANSVMGAPIDSGANCLGTLASLGYNLDSGTSCALSATGDISSTDPLLGPLADNGGATLTRQLQVGSRAIDAGHNASCPPSDQRGVGRPQGDRCDIGAYETIGYTNNVSVTVTGGDCITSTTLISNSFLIGSLHLGVNATLAPRGDFRVKLYAPDLRSIQVLGATGGSGQNLDVLWDDDSPLGPVGDENQDINIPYYKYVRVPDQSLVPLFGRSLRGTWQLELCNLGATSATLNHWSLLVPSVAPPKVFLPLVRRR
jgi:subtilisin-like proprotein convertase family protein